MGRESKIAYLAHSSVFSFSAGMIRTATTSITKNKLGVHHVLVGPYRFRQRSRTETYLETAYNARRGQGIFSQFPGPFTNEIHTLKISSTASRVSK